MNALIADVRAEVGTKPAPPPWRVPAALPAEAFEALRRRVILDCCKWDPQVGDVSTLAPFPLVLRADTWCKLAGWAESLTVETFAAEEELLRLPKMHKVLSLPWRIRSVLRRARSVGLTATALRIMRFDFHLTTEGWRISEVNSDVPGGFTESTSFTNLMAAHHPDTVVVGDPTEAVIEALAKAAQPGRVVALLFATGYMEDQQIVMYLAKRLRQRGCTPHIPGPTQILWRDGRAFLDSAWHRGPLDAVFRFYQGEWLAHLHRRCGWPHFFCGGRTPVANPGVALLSESKRFALTWDSLSSPMRTWRSLFPETRDPRHAPWGTDEGWILKTALCNNGDTVSLRSRMDAKQWKAVSRDVRWHPGHWVAQSRFQPVPVATPLGPLYPCIGIYTVNGRVGGAYARVASGPLIDYAAVDIAVLVDPPDETSLP